MPKTDIDERRHAEVERWQANAQLVMAQRLSTTGSFTTDLVADEHIWSEKLSDQLITCHQLAHPRVEFGAAKPCRV